MASKIKVELKNGAACEMSKSAFNVFLAQDKVARFRRAEGWVHVEDTSLRDLLKNDARFLEGDRRSFI